jgi:tripartite-type tricarboxylate transporter receptor subunit TctC
MITRRRLIRSAAATMVAPGLLGRPAAAQTWPSRFVRLLVPLAPGGPTDFAARLIAEPLSRIWGQQVVIENKPGAGGNLAAEVVARSEPDGYTMLYGTSSVAINRVLYRSLSYDPIADFAPISQLTRFPFFMFVPMSLPVTTVAQFIAYAKSKNGGATLASPGAGSAPHLAGELFQRMAGIKLTHVPYRGASVVLNDLIPGRVDLYFASGALLTNMRGGQIRGLAVTGHERDPTAPELPTVEEAGVPGFEVSSWHGLFVPAATPASIVKKMNADAIAAIADPIVQEKYRLNGYRPVGSSGEELGRLVKSEIAKWTPVVREAGIPIID